MAQELKIRITDPQTIETKLQSLGATFLEETNFTDTYFKQPEGEVFKVSDTDKGFFLIQLQRTPEGKFEVIKNNPIEHADQVVAEMTNEYGVKRVLHGKSRTLNFPNLILQINSFEEIGAFLIITGENLSQELVTTQLGITNPEYITVSFDNLPALTPMPPTPPSPAQS